jgi:alkylhydroperoxidase/carboxymuconolactone decarboxylase family protein YurZ
MAKTRPRGRHSNNTEEDHRMLPPRVDLETIRRRIGTYADRKQTAEQRGEFYKELLGFVPPRIEARLQVTGALDPEMLDLQEKIRAHGMYPKCFDVKTSQLMLFGMLLMDLSDAAALHGIAARRAGATWEEMQAVVSLCFLFRGLSAANRGAEILANIARREEETEAKK